MLRTLPTLRVRPTVLVALAAALTVSAACGKDEAPETATAETDDLGYSPEYWQSQRQFIDSVINTAPDVAEVAKTKGAIYQVADDSLAAIVKNEAQKTEDCYSKVGLGYDPHLAGVATVLVNFGAAGWDLVRVEDHKFSSAAGGAVVSCINARAKNEWVLPTKGVKAGAHLVQLTFRPDAGAGERKVY
jgi:hypothetical protein